MFEFDVFEDTLLSLLIFDRPSALGILIIGMQPRSRQQKRCAFFLVAGTRAIVWFGSRENDRPLIAVVPESVSRLPPIRAYRSIVRSFATMRIDCEAG
jgi:hypothetical protein